MDRLRAKPALERVLARSEFTRGFTVRLAHWTDWAEATTWCESRWTEFGHQYRRSLNVSAEVAVFTLANHIDAVELALKFG